MSTNNSNSNSNNSNPHNMGNPNGNNNLNSNNNSNGSNNSNNNSGSTPNNGKDPWQLEEPSDRQKLIRFIIDWVKEGATDDELLDILIPHFFKLNDILPFDREDIKGIIWWARKKFPKNK